MTNRALAAAAIVAATTLGGACTVHQSSTQTPSGPSQLALTVTLTATPDSVSQDGASQSKIVASVVGPDGKPSSGRVLRLDMSVSGVIQDFGALSARTVVTGNDGTGFSIYTAPPPPPALQGGAVTPVIIVATLTGSDATVSPASGPPTVLLRLVPPGVILPPAPTPVSLFTFSPSPVNANIAVIFDGSTSCGNPLSGGVCPPANPQGNTSAITSYSWNFGDGSTGTGKTSTHTFTTAGSFNVTLTVTNDRGVIATSSQSVTVGLSPTPTAAFVFSPSTPTIGQTVVFNASTSTAAPGRTLTQFNWIFGDGGSATGFLASYTFTVAGTYNVTLSVLDDVGQKATATQSVTIAAGGAAGGGGAPVPRFTSSPTTPVVNELVVFDSSSSTVAPGRSLVDYAWNFGDDTPIIHGNNRIISHTYARPDTFVVNLVVTDNTGATGQVTNPVLVGSGDPVPVITFSPSGGTHPVTVAFSSVGTILFSGASVQTYAWDFGDPLSGSNTSAVQNPTHSYNNAGTFTVRLTITDTQNRVGTATVSVTVQ
jgi:PKD repeat protein